MLSVRYFPFQRYYLFTFGDWIVLQVRPDEIPKTLDLLKVLGYRTRILLMANRFISEAKLLEHARDNESKSRHLRRDRSWAFSASIQDQRLPDNIPRTKQSRL